LTSLEVRHGTGCLRSHIVADTQQERTASPSQRLVLSGIFAGLIFQEC
jgi:hypothetical protein